MTGRIDMSLATQIDALNERIDRYRATYPTDRDEIERLANLDLSESAVATAASDEDRAEIDRLKAVAAELTKGTPAASDDASDDAEVQRLAAVAKEMR